MIKVIFLLTTALSLTTHATCNGDITAGGNSYNFASNYFNLGMSSYESAVEESQKPEPDMAIVCNHLLNSYSGFFTAKNSFLDCRNLFSSATKKCTGNLKLQAMQASNACFESFETAGENLDFIRTNIETVCFKEQ